MRALYTHLRLSVNFFSPQMKLIAKSHRGAQVTKTFDRARTPYRRILESAEVSKSSKRELEATYLTLNPAELRRRIGRCQDRLIELVKTKQERRKEVRRPPSTPSPGSMAGPPCEGALRGHFP